MDFIDSFIQEYKNNPCLWKADCADFKNKNKRQEAYNRLINVAASHGEHYNVERTKQKINNLRCAFRHQLKRCEEVISKGEKYENYSPKRRYFESLMFLKDEECTEKKFENVCSTENSTLNLDPPKANDNRGAKNSRYSQVDFSRVPEVDAFGCVEKSFSKDEGCILGIESESQSSNVFKSYGTEQRMPKPDRNEVTEFDCLVEKDGDNLAKSELKNYRKRSSSMSSEISHETERNNKAVKLDVSTIDLERLLSAAFRSINNHIDDHFTNFGKLVEHKLRSMESTQAMYAEKIITDVLYQGHLKLLSSLSIKPLNDENTNSFT